MSPKRVNLTLSGEALEALAEIAGQRGLTLPEVLWQAIGHEVFLSDETRAGNRVFIENSNARVRRELLIP